MTTPERPPTPSETAYRAGLLAATTDRNAPNPYAPAMTIAAQRLAQLWWAGRLRHVPPPRDATGE